MKIVSQDGETVFDFGSDALGHSFLWRSAVAAKFPEDYVQTVVSMNQLTNDVFAALEASAPPLPPVYLGGKRVRPTSPAPHNGNASHVNQRSAESIVHEVLVKRAVWFGASQEQRDRLIQHALFPFHEHEVDVIDVRGRVEAKLEPHREELLDYWSSGENQEMRQSYLNRLEQRGERPWSPNLSDV